MGLNCNASEPSDPANFSSNKSNSKRKVIEQDLESINAILDRYGITPITRLSLGPRSGSYCVKISQEKKEESLNNENKSNYRKRTATFPNSAGNGVHNTSTNPQNTDKNSYLLSQDYEISRPYELEPNYSKFY